MQAEALCMQWLKQMWKHVADVVDQLLLEFGACRRRVVRRGDLEGEVHVRLALLARRRLRSVSITAGSAGLAGCGSGGSAGAGQIVLSSSTILALAVARGCSGERLVLTCFADLHALAYDLI